MASKTGIEKLYGRTDINDVSVPQPDGSTHHHTRTKTMGAGPFVLSCESCIDWLVTHDPAIVTKDGRGATTSSHWSTSEKQVPQSSDEIEAQDEMERQMAVQSGRDYEDFRRWQAEQRGRPVGTAHRR